MAPEWLGGFELRRLNASQSWQRLPAFQLEFDPAFQNLTQCLRGLVAGFAISPCSGKPAQLGINFLTVVDLLVPRVLQSGIDVIVKKLKRSHASQFSLLRANPAKIYWNACFMRPGD